MKPLFAIARVGAPALMICLGGPMSAWAREDRPVAEQQKIAAIERSIQTSAENLKTYEWVETTVVSVKGVETIREQSRCHYGEDGALVKVPAGDAPALTGREKRDLAAYVDQAKSLIELYLPPDRQRLRAAEQAGRTILTVHDDATRFWLEVPGFRKAGDVLRVEVDPSAERLVGLAITTYADRPNDVVSFDVRFGVLEDGTTYPATVCVDRGSKEVRIALENSGYRKRGS